MKRTDYWAKLEPGQVYHFYNHAVGYDNLFEESSNYAFFLLRWKHYWASYMDVYAYCLMPNHFHVIGRLKPVSQTVQASIQRENTSKASAYLKGEEPVNRFYEDQFRRLFTSYSKAFGKTHVRNGSLFRAKFKRILIRSREHLLDKILYVHHNPIHHGFCMSYTDYSYSSYHDYLVGNDEYIYLPALKFFQDMDGFIQAHEDYRANYKGDIRGF